MMAQERGEARHFAAQMIWAASSPPAKWPEWAVADRRQGSDGARTPLGSGFAAASDGGARISVGFLTEGTYPFYGGGVSTWSDLLVHGLSEIDFHVIATTSQPCLASRYPLPENVRSLVQVPLWGASPSDALHQDTGAWRLARQRLQTDEWAIRRGFIPAFRIWLECLYNERSEQDWDACGAALAEMARFLRSHDYATTFRARPVCESYTAVVAERYRPAPLSTGSRPWPSLADVSATLAWLPALMRPLALAPTRVDLYHATVAAPVSLIGIVAHVEKGTPLLLTEHGIYFRERAISASGDARLSFFQKHFLIRMAEVISHLCYHYADLIAPVCRFNSKWEMHLGALPGKIRVIYNAVDTERFAPRAKPAEASSRPTVVVVANVTPIKDIMTLIRTAALVCPEVPDVRFMVYGSLTADPGYVVQCRELIRTLGLESAVFLAGHHPKPELLYLEGDITVLSSISEAFPFTVLESMACGRPVVATNVGGVAEALGDAGIVVPPRSPAELAEVILTLLRDGDHRWELGQRSRLRALQHFQIRHLLDSYAEAYHDLMV